MGLKKYQVTQFPHSAKILAVKLPVPNCDKGKCKQINVSPNKNPLKSYINILHLIISKLILNKQTKLKVVVKWP
jgi:hypothetical protein